MVSFGVLALPPYAAFLYVAILDIINIVLTSLALLLPQLSFTVAVQTGLLEFIPFLGNVAYFVPVTEMLVLGGTWLAAITSWYVCAAILKFIRLR